MAGNVEMQPGYVRWFSDLGAEDVALVGGKNGSLGECVF